MNIGNQISQKLREELIDVLRKRTIDQLMDTEVGPNLDAYDLLENICSYTGITEDDALDPSFEWR